jgi:transposase-like protein
MAITYVRKQYFDTDGKLFVKPYRLSDLATIFDVNRKTMRKWLDRYPDELGNREGKYFSVRQVQFCLEKFGLPGKVIVLNQTKKAA